MKETKIEKLRLRIAHKLFKFARWLEPKRVSDLLEDEIDDIIINNR